MSIQPAFVDSIRLDSDLTDIAAAIRAKGETSESLAFPQGFIEAIDAIQLGGGNEDAFITRTYLNVYENSRVTKIGDCAFKLCSKIHTFSFPNISQIGNYAFERCSILRSLYLMGDTVCNLIASNAFTSVPRAQITIYVPSSLISSYKTATNWTYFSSRFSAI